MGTIKRAEFTLPRRFDLEITGYGKNVFLVRSLVDQAARRWGLSDDVRESARLVLTELAANAARIYEGRTIGTWVTDSGDGGLELAVWDPGHGQWPTLLPTTEDSERGRGLWLVRELSEGRWGWHLSETAHGKVVWARVGP
jgi:anti-sigma regulatory factor (Ser/Thr protein kinase)